MRQLIEKILFAILVTIFTVSGAEAASAKTKPVQPIKDWEWVSSVILGTESIRLSSCDPVCATSRTSGNELLFGFQEEFYYMGTRRGKAQGKFPIKFDIGLEGLFTQTFLMRANDPGDLDNRTLGLLLALRFPVTDKWNFKVAHGVGYSVTQIGFDNGLIAESRDVSPMTEIGAEYRVNDTFAFFAGLRHMKNRHHFEGVTASTPANGISLAKGTRPANDDKDCDDDRNGGSGGTNAGNNGGSSDSASHFSNSISQTNIGVLVGISVHAPIAWL